MKIDPHIEQRLQTERNIWLATVRSDGRPHLVPIWFVWHAHKIYICTEAHSVKARNMFDNPNVAISLQDGDKPIVLEGQARTIEQTEPALVAAFQSKYDWNITTDVQYNQMIEIEVKRIRA
jgi:PPOX class probable F420-dependent enzyme